MLPSCQVYHTRPNSKEQVTVSLQCLTELFPVTHSTDELIKCWVQKRQQVLPTVEKLKFHKLLV